MIITKNHWEPRRVSDFSSLKNWFTNYFLFKISDYIILNFSIIILIILFFKKNIYFDKNFKNKKYLLNFFLIIIPIALIWFLKHPSLRYGGYIIFSLFIIFSFFLFFRFISTNAETLKKKIGILIILSITYFNISNIHRVNKEINSQYIFKYSNFPFFSLDENLLYKDKLTLLNSKYKSKVTKSLLKTG